MSCSSVFFIQAVFFFIFYRHIKATLCRYWYFDIFWDLSVSIILSFSSLSSISATRLFVSFCCSSFHSNSHQSCNYFPKGLGQGNYCCSPVLIKFSPSGCTLFPCFQNTCRCQILSSWLQCVETTFLVPMNSSLETVQMLFLWFKQVLLHYMVYGYHITADQQCWILHTYIFFSQCWSQTYVLGSKDYRI